MAGSDPFPPYLKMHLLLPFRGGPPNTTIPEQLYRQDELVAWKVMLAQKSKKIFKINSTRLRGFGYNHFLLPPADLAESSRSRSNVLLPRFPDAPQSAAEIPPCLLR